MGWVGRWDGVAAVLGTGRHSDRCLAQVHNEGIPFCVLGMDDYTFGSLCWSGHGAFRAEVFRAQLSMGRINWCNYIDNNLLLGHGRGVN